MVEGIQDHISWIQVYILRVVQGILPPEIAQKACTNPHRMLIICVLMTKSRIVLGSNVHFLLQEETVCISYCNEEYLDCWVQLLVFKPRKGDPNSHI